MNLNITDNENDTRIRLYGHICNVLILCNWPARYLHKMFVELMFPAGDSGLFSAVPVSPEFRYRPWIKLPISNRVIVDVVISALHEPPEQDYL